MSSSGPRDTPNALGTILIVLMLLAPLAALGWLIYDPYGWFDGWRVNRAGGILLFIAGAIALGALYFLAFLIWAIVTTVLEKLGVPLSKPALAGPGSLVPGPQSLVPGPQSQVPGPQSLAPMHGLTAEEATRAQCVGVTLLYAVGTDEHGWPESYLESVAYCLNDAEDRREREARPLKPGWDGLNSSEPMVLLDLVAGGRVSAGQARAFLARIDAGEPYHALEPPLTDEERTRAAGIQVWTVWYEDQFGTGGQRDSFPVAVCLSREEADRVCASRGRPLEPGFDGYTVAGPVSLDKVGRPGVTRRVMALAAAGQGGSVPIG